jgi:hypothetical protein
MNETHILNIVTPCGLFPQNLGVLYDSIYKQDHNKFQFEVRWHVCIDTLSCSKEDIDPKLFDHFDSFTETEDGCWGNQCKNKAMENVKEGWVYLLDDDNIIHDEFYSALRDEFNQAGDYLVYAFHHDTGDKNARLLDRYDKLEAPIRKFHPQVDSETELYVDSTFDSGQAVFHHSIWTPWPVNTESMEQKTKHGIIPVDGVQDADFQFYQNIRKRDLETGNDRIKIVDRCATFYNRLRW